MGYCLGKNDLIAIASVVIAVTVYTLQKQTVFSIGLSKTFPNNLIKTAMLRHDQARHSFNPVHYILHAEGLSLSVDVKRRLTDALTYDAIIAS